MADLFGTSFAQSGFSYDPNLSPNNRGFAAAVRAVINALGFTGFGTSTFAVVAGTASSLAPSGFANPTVKVSTTATNGVATTAMRSDAAPAVDQAAAYTWTGTNTFNPASGVPLTVQIGNTTAFAVVGTASLTGRGNAAAAPLDMSVDFQTVGLALQGVTPAVNGTATFRRIGPIATMTITVAGTSNAVTAALAGIPAAWQPAVRQIIPTNGEDTGVNVPIMVDLNGGTWQLYRITGTATTQTGGGFTASGQKGCNLSSVTYQLL